MVVVGYGWLLLVLVGCCEVRTCTKAVGSIAHYRGHSLGHQVGGCGFDGPPHDLMVLRLRHGTQAAHWEIGHSLTFYNFIQG